MADGIDWGMLAQYPNAGQAFSQAFQQGQEKNALSGLVMNPTNPQAFSNAVRVDPQMAMQFRSQQIAAAHAQLEQRQGDILKGAEIVRQMQPRDQAGWDQTLLAAHTAGVDISGVPREFNPTYVHGLVTIADAYKPDPNSAPTGLQRETEYLNSQHPGWGDARQMNLVNPLQPIQTANKDGTITVNWVRPPMPGAPAQTQGGLPTAATPQEAAKYPPGTQFQLPDGRIGTVPGQGGQTPPASGGFPK